MAAALAFGTLAFSTTEARAFCRTSTDGTRAGCTVSDSECCSKGKLLYWANSCVGFSLQKNASQQVSYERALEVIGGAFAKWSGAACSSGSPVSLQFRNLGPVNCSVVGYNKEAKNQNVITFRDDGWDDDHKDGGNTLGLTTVVFNPDDGEIFDADMEINTSGSPLTVQGAVPPNGYDFESIVTHEAGHFLGLAHSLDRNATMYAQYTPGQTFMRDLSEDDIAGVCGVYLPPKQGKASGERATTGDGGVVAAGACNPEPRHGFSTECNEPSDEENGCSVSSPGQSGSTGRGVGLLAALGIVLGLGVRRVSRRRRASSTRT